jgi:purine-cytosine permease-like protein
MEDFIGLLVPFVLPAIIVFIVLFFNNRESKNKYGALVRISKFVNDPAQIDALIKSLEKDETPYNYKRQGLVATFTGIGIYLLGMVALGNVVEGLGLLIIAIGTGMTIAGYIFPEDKD